MKVKNDRKLNQNRSHSQNQSLEFFPFGETLVEEHLNSYNSPFKFNAKELDAETGNYYYGARYYDPKWSVWLSVDAEFARFPSYSPYNYTMLNPINLVDPDGNAPINPIKKQIFKKSTGNTGSYNLRNFRFTPASNQSWSGKTTTGYITKDRQSSFTKTMNKFLDVNMPQYVRSASISTSENKGQYFNDKGEQVDNISDASQLIISEYRKTETINLYEGGIYGDITIEESVNSIVFDIIDGGNLSFNNSELSSVTKTKNVKNISDELADLTEVFSAQNKSKSDIQIKHTEAKLLEGHMKDNVDAVIRESKQDKFAY